MYEMKKHINEVDAITTTSNTNRKCTEMDDNSCCCQSITTNTRPTNTEFCLMKTAITSVFHRFLARFSGMDGVDTKYNIIQRFEILSFLFFVLAIRQMKRFDFINKKKKKKKKTSKNIA